VVLPAGEGSITTGQRRDALSATAGASRGDKQGPSAHPENASRQGWRAERDSRPDALADIGHAELRTWRAFLLPGFAKFVVVEKAATEVHEGVNPFTKEKMMVSAKPASKAVRARPVKAAKDAVS
jgi:DNA-binding protein HU-beta